MQDSEYLDKKIKIVHELHTVAFLVMDWLMPPECI